MGKDAANQVISIRSAVYYGDHGLPGIDPQVVMGPGSPNADKSWKRDFTQDSDYSPGNGTMSSNHDLDEILDSSLDSTESVSYESNPSLDDQGSHFEADLAIPCASAIPTRSVGSSGSVPNKREASVPPIISYHSLHLLSAG